MDYNEKVQPILDVAGLSVSFEYTCVLNNLSFSLKRGECLGIVGESGSGKSITALSLMGLLPAGARITQSKAILHAHSGSSFSLFSNNCLFEQVRGRQIAMIFQEPMTSLNPSMRCGQQIEEVIALHQRVKKIELRPKSLALLQEMQIPDPLKAYRSYPHELSGGQKQRVMIAMALAGNPDILIADEPTTALDVTVQRDIINLLKDIVASRGMSLIFISHDLGVVSQITHRILVLKNGELVEEGETQKVLNNPQKPYTKGLLACRPPLNERPQALPTVEQFLLGNKSEPVNNIDIEKQNAQIYSQNPILQVKNLYVDFITKRSFLGKPLGFFRAVNNVSIQLFPGETLGLVGESGCGKTTLGRTIVGLTPYKKGHILYNGDDIGSLTCSKFARYRQDVQLVFQDPFSSLNPRHTVGEAIMEPISFYDKDKSKSQVKQRAMELLDYVALPSASFFRYPHEFSGGQRQRVAIARALAVNPKVLICDEMVSALDVSVQAQILNLLNRLKAEFGLTYIFISHDLSVVKYMSNKILVMQQGSVVESGFADQVYNAPNNSYTKKLIASIPAV